MNDELQSEADKPVPTFGTATQYMQLLWRMDAMYSGVRSKSDAPKTKRERFMERQADEYQRQVATRQDVSEAAIDAVLAVTSYHAPDAETPAKPTDWTVT